MKNDSIAGQAYRNIAQRLIGEPVPFINLEENESFLKVRALKLEECHSPPISSTPGVQ